MSKIYMYILVMALTTYAIRVLPVTLMRKQVKNKFIKSFLYYVPFVTLAVMTFPAIMQCTQVPLAGILALIAGIVAAYFGAGLFPVAILCCVTVFICEFIML